MRPSQTAQSPEAGHTKEESTYTRMFPWTVTHSFYAIMGGFAFDNLSNKAEFPLPQGRTRLTLSSDALMFLAEFEPHLVPDISEDTIRDKSKSDGIAKAIAFWQALWFTAQFSVRVAQGLNVSMLELHTVLHVVCAVIAYFVFWWKKPLDIMEPTLIAVKSRDTAIICAAMTAVSEVGRLSFRLPRDVTKQTQSIVTRNTGSHFSSLALTIVVLFAAPTFPYNEIHLPSQANAALESALLGDADKASPEQMVFDMAKLAPPSLAPSELPHNVLVRYPQNWGIPSQGLVIRAHIRSLAQPESYSWSYEAPLPLMDFLFPGHEEASVTINSEDLRRYYFAAHGFSKYPALMVWKTGGFVFPRAKSIAAGLVEVPISLSEGITVSAVGFCVASVAYGGVHLLLGWNGPMNTQAEILLWRIAGFAIAAPWGPFIVGVALLLAIGSMLAAIALPLFLYFGLVSVLEMDYLREPLTRWAKVTVKHYFPFIFRPVYFLLTTGIILLILFSRLYILVECFYSVLFVPPSVYQVPVWASYVFHF